MEHEVDNRGEEWLNDQPGGMGRAPDPELDVEHLGQGQEVDLLGQGRTHYEIQMFRKRVVGANLPRLPGVKKDAVVRPARGRGGLGTGPQEGLKSAAEVPREWEE